MIKKIKGLSNNTGQSLNKRSELTNTFNGLILIIQVIHTIVFEVLNLSFQ